MSEKSVSVRLSANISAYKAAMAEAAGATNKFSQQTQSDLKQVGGKMQEVGGKMTVGVTLPLVAAGGAALKFSGDFNRTFGQMVGLAGVPADEVERLKESVLDLAGETAQAPQDLAESLYFAASAGLDSAQAMDAVTIAAKAAQVGMGSTQDVVGLVASAMATYGSDTIDAARATDILTATIREGRAEPSELASTLGRVLPVANQIGVSFEEVGGTVAYLSNVFGDTNRTVTATQGLFTKLASPTQQGRDALADFGLTASQLQAAIDQDGLLGALDLLKSVGFDQNAQAMAALFDDMEGRSAALALLGADAATLTGIFDATASSTGALDDALAGVDKNANAMSQAWVDIQVALIEAGQIIGPVAADLAEWISAIVSSFADLPGPLQAVVVGFLAVVAAVGPIVKMGGMVVSNLQAMATGFSVLRGVMVAHPILAFAGIAATVGAALYVMSQKATAGEKAIADMAESMRQAEDVAGGLVGYLANAVEQSDLLLTAMDGAGVSIEEMSAAAQAGGPRWDMMSKSILASAQAAGFSGLELEALGKALDGIPARADAAREKADALARVNETTASATEEMTGAIEEQQPALEGAESAWADVAERIAAAREEHEKMIESIISGTAGLYDYDVASLNVSNGYRELQQNIADTNEVLADGTLTADEHATALTNLALDEFALAQEVLRAAEAYALQQGAVDGSAESAQAQIEELERQRAMYPELADEIDGFIAHLLMVPGTVSTVVSADTKQADEAIRILRDNIASLSIGLNGVRTSTTIKTGPSNRERAEGAAAWGSHVYADAMYEVGEYNRPELFIAGGHQFLIPGNDGRVEPISPNTSVSSASGSSWAPAFPASLTLYIDGQPIKARVDELDRQRMVAAMAGRVD